MRTLALPASRGAWIEPRQGDFAQSGGESPRGLFKCLAAWAHPKFGCSQSVTSVVPGRSMFLVDGDTAVVSETDTVRGSQDGTPLVFAVRATTTYIWRDGK